MISISLTDVVAFLRPRDALGVLEGAPFFYAHEAAAPDLRSVNLRELTQIGNVERVATVLLYLGDGEICPAAEGWAARVLALAKGYGLSASPYFLHAHDGVVVLLGYDGGEMADLGVWMHPEIRGPAARLAAVLTYEMERAK